MSGKGRGSNYSVTRQDAYRRKKKGEEQKYVQTAEEALKTAGF